MDPFLGKWKVELEKTTGVEEMGKLFGWNEEKRIMYATTPYTLLMEKKGDGFSGFLDYTQFHISILFKLDEEVEYASPDGTKALMVVRIENDQMMENYRTKEGITWKTSRRLEGGNNMIAETTCESDKSIKCIQYLTRV